MNKVVVLKKNLVIPAGTVFENCDGVTVDRISGNYEARVSTSKDSTASFVVDEDVIADNPGHFEYVDADKWEKEPPSFTNTGV